MRKLNPTHWKARLPALFRKVRRDFDLQEQVGLGTDGFWHPGMASGIVLPMKSKRVNAKLVWETPYVMTGGKKIDEYHPASAQERVVLPTSRRTGTHGYLISINPAPGLQRKFSAMTDHALSGLLAHEFAECLLAAKETNFHERITHHGLPESKVDQIAAQKGYRKEVEAYLVFLRQHIHQIKPREPLPDILDLLPGHMISIGQKRTYSVEAARNELEDRLRKIKQFEN